MTSRSTNKKLASLLKIEQRLDETLRDFLSPSPASNWWVLIWHRPCYPYERDLPQRFKEVSRQKKGNFLQWASWENCQVHCKGVWDDLQRPWFWLLLWVGWARKEVESSKQPWRILHKEKATSLRLTPLELSAWPSLIRRIVLPTSLKKKCLVILLLP